MHFRIQTTRPAAIDVLKRGEHGDLCTRVLLFQEGVLKISSVLLLNVDN